MKKLLSIAFCAAVGSTFAAAEVGEVGVTAINSGMANTVVAISYKDLVSGGDISVSNLVKTTNLTVNDQLAVFNGTDYDTWTLADGTGGAKYWAKNAKTYKVGSSGALTVGTGDSGDTTTLPAGTGIWLCRQSYSDPFYIYGKPANQTQVTASGTKLVGNPTQSAKVPTITGMANRDRIEVPSSDAFLARDMYQYVSKSNGWFKVDKTDGKIKMVDLPEIPAGTGFWYVGPNSTATISWED